MERRLFIASATALGIGLVMPDATPLEAARETTRRLRQGVDSASLSARLNLVRGHVQGIRHVIPHAKGTNDRREGFLALAEAEHLHTLIAEDSLYLGEARDAVKAAIEAAEVARELATNPEQDRVAAELLAIAWTQHAACETNHGSPFRAVRAAREGQRAPNAAIKANAACWEALAFSRRSQRLGERHADNYGALSAVDRAYVLIEKGEEHPLKRFEHASVQGFAGLVQSRVGLAREAEQSILAGMGDYPADSNSRIWSNLNLVETYVAMGEPEAAADSALDAYRAASARDSGFKVSTLRPTATRLFRRWPDVAKVKELRGLLTGI